MGKEKRIGEKRSWFRTSSERRGRSKENRKRNSRLPDRVFSLMANISTRAMVFIGFQIYDIIILLRWHFIMTPTERERETWLFVLAARPKTAQGCGVDAIATVVGININIIIVVVVVGRYV